MKRIANLLAGAIFIPFGLACGLAGALRFTAAATKMSERQLEGMEAGDHLVQMLIGMALVALGYWGVSGGWKRLKLGWRGEITAAPAPQPAQAPAAPAAPPPAAATPGPRPAVLALLHAGKTVRVTAADGEITLGRGSDCRVVVASPHVSRHHARIAWDTAGLPRLTNLSQAGTSIRFKGEAGFRAYSAEAPLKDEGSIALSADGADAATRNEVIHFAVTGA